MRIRKSAAAQKRRRPAGLRPAAVQDKVKKSFAKQVAAFIERYRPALEALAKR